MAVVSAAVLLIALLSWPPKVRPAGPTQPVLVELFTSEGCSSCPPADRLLAELDRKQPVAVADIIVLSEHVDYWNSLGWRDPYSSHQWSERQDDYARRFSLDGAYTPQIVIDGEYQMVGSDSRAVRAAIEKSALQPRVAIDITDATFDKDQLQLSFSAGAGPNAALYAALADDADRSSVARGENAGRTLDHVAVARSLTQLGKLQSTVTEKTVTIHVPQGTNPHPRVILFAQEPGTGRIVGVAQRKLP